MVVRFQPFDFRIGLLPKNTVNDCNGCWKVLPGCKLCNVYRRNIHKLHQVRYVWNSLIAVCPFSSTTFGLCKLTEKFNDYDSRDRTQDQKDEVWLSHDMRLPVGL